MKSERSRIRLAAALLYDVSRGRLPHILQRGKSIADIAALRLELDRRLVHRRRQDRDAPPLGLAREAVELVGVGHVERHGGGEELLAMVRLEIGGLIGDQRIGGGVALVEAVARELRDQLEDVARAGLLDAFLQRAFHEARALRIHLGLDLLAHGAAQEVGFAEAVARQHLRELHHLLLVDDDAVGLFQDRLGERMQVVRLLDAVLAVDVSLDVVHRAGPIQRHHSDDVAEAVGLELAQRLAHARTFELEHAAGIALRNQLVSGADRRAAE